MTNPRFTITTDLWIWSTDKGPAKWHFLSVKGDVGDEIEGHAVMARLEMGGGRRRGFGAVKVRATIGKTIWETSIFPDKDEGGYLLPVKAAVRKAEDLAPGGDVTAHLELI